METSGGGEGRLQRMGEPFGQGFLKVSQNVGGEKEPGLAVWVVSWVSDMQRSWDGNTSSISEA